MSLRLKLVLTPAEFVWKFLRYEVKEPTMLLGWLLIIASGLFSIAGGYYYGKWLMVLFGGIVIVGHRIAKLYGKWPAIAVCYFLTSGMWFWMSPWNRYLPVIPYDQDALKLFSADSSLKLMLVLAPFLLLTPKRKRLLEFGGLAVAFFCVLDPLWTIWAYFKEGWCLDENSCGGSMGNPSMNACALATALPIMWDQIRGPYRWIVLAMVAAVVYVTRSSLGAGMMVSWACLELFPWAKITALRLTSFRVGLIGALIPNLMMLGGSVGVITALSWRHLGKAELFNSGDRFMMWNTFMAFWVRNPLHWITGTGFGNFGVFSRHIQGHMQLRNGQWWLWEHNDWYELLFVGGFPGLFLALAVYVSAEIALLRRKEYAEAKSLIQFGIFMFFNYPLHVALTCTFAGWIISVALYRDPRQNPGLTTY